jgi:16S rRNA (cytosine967-C5)-methyltransferase
LARARGLVCPGGRLIYAVCSLLPSEGEDVVDDFLANNPDFEALTMADVWRGALPGVDCPAGEGVPHLILSPAQHATDGFFVAVLERRGEGVSELS